MRPAGDPLSLRSFDACPTGILCRLHPYFDSLEKSQFDKMELLNQENQH